MNKYKLDKETGLLTIIRENGTTIVVDLDNYFQPNQFVVGKEEKKPSLLTRIKENWFSLSFILFSLLLVIAIGVLPLLIDKESYSWFLITMGSATFPLILLILGFANFNTRKDNDK